MQRQNTPFLLIRCRIHAPHSGQVGPFGVCVPKTVLLRGLSSKLDEGGGFKSI